VIIACLLAVACGLGLLACLMQAERKAANFERLWRQALKYDVSKASLLEMTIRYDRKKKELSKMTHERDVWRDGCRDAIAYFRDQTKPLPVELTGLLEKGDQE
jgi:hypothetical protein